MWLGLGYKNNSSRNSMRNYECGFRCSSCQNVTYPFKIRMMVPLVLKFNFSACSEDGPDDDDAKSKHIALL